MLWKDSTIAYRKHYKYFTNSIIKPFNMSIDDYITRMNEYAELLQYLPPPSTKGCKSIEADWKKLKSLGDADIREAIYDGLPDAYHEPVRRRLDKYGRTELP
jgi:hypothetical protein